MSTPAGDGQIGDATITVTANTTAAALAIRGLTRDANGNLRDMRGRFVSESRLINNSLNTITGGSNRFKDALDSLRGASLLLSPALIPIAAAAAPIAASVGAAALAVGAFGAAAAGQVVAISEAAEAETKYTDAVEEHGKASKEATDAEKAYLAAVQKLPPATRQAAAGLSVLKDEYKAWSDSLAGDTMPVATKSFAVFGAVFPKLTPLVKGASGELNRFVTIVAGGIQSRSFDRFMASFSTFATGALAKANDGLIRLTRTMDTGKIGGGLSEFMQYAKENGPLVGDTLQNVAQALTKLLIAGSEVGVGLLTVVNAFTSLVAAIPTELLTNLLQVAIAFKAVKLAAAGFSAVSAGLLAVTTQITAMRVAAAASTGSMAALTAAFGALSRGAQLAVAGTAIGLVVVGLIQLSQLGQRAAPDVDRLTTSLGQFARSGKVAGELAKTFGKDLSGLEESLRVIARPSTTQAIEQSVSAFLGYGKGGPEAKKAAEALDAVDKSLANLVKGGQADLAAAALKRTAGSLENLTASELDKELGDYRSALEDMKLEAQLTADAMGLFGAQAQATSTKLAAQKQSADGLRQAVQALNDVNRQALGGMIGFEAAIDAAAAAAQENTGSLRMVNGQLDLNSPKAQAAASALNDLAARTDENTAAARANFASWETVNGIYQRGRGELVKSAIQMGLTETQAKKLADQILKTPDKTTKITMETEDATRDLGAFNAKVKQSPGSKSVTLATLSERAEEVLESFGYKVTHLKDGSVSVSAATGGALRDIGNVAGQLRALDGRKATTFVETVYFSNQRPGPHSSGYVFRAQGGLVGRAAGGLVGFPHGGPVRGPGTGTSDSILTALSNGEFVIRASSVDKYGPELMEAINDGRFPRPARGGAPAAAMLGVGAVRTAGRGGSVVVTNHFHLENRGVIGSQFEVENWLIRALDTAARTGRLPRSLTVGV